MCIIYHIASPPANMTTQSLSCTNRAVEKKNKESNQRPLFCFFFMACLDEVHCVTTSALRNYKTAKVETEKKKEEKTKKKGGRKHTVQQ